MKYLKIPSWADCEIAVREKLENGEPATALEWFIYEFEHTYDPRWRSMLAAVLADMMPQGAKVEW